MNVTTPLELVLALAGLIVSLAPLLEPRLTVFAATGLDCASSKVTVMVAVVVPFAVSVLAVDAIFEIVGLTAPVLKVTVGVVDKTTPSVVSVAV